MTPYKIEHAVSGDISIAIFFGQQFLGQRLHSRPPLAFAFHTAFVEAETVRITPAQLDAADPSIFAPTAAQSFFMDIVLKDQASLASRLSTSVQPGACWLSTSTAWCKRPEQQLQGPPRPQVSVIGALGFCDFM